jgi:hypothetical protein
MCCPLAPEMQDERGRIGRSTTATAPHSSNGAIQPFRAPLRPKSREVLDRVIERLIAYFARQGIGCDVRLESGAILDSEGRLHPGFR